jgi:hypothetical protein
MLTDLDRIVIATRYRRPVVQALSQALGAEVVGGDRLPFWSAHRTTMRAGVSEVEVLEPSGVGALADFVGRRGPGLFAVGLATADREKFRAHLEARGVLFEEHGDQLFLTSDRGVDLPGLNLVFTPARKREAAGLLKRVCAATLLFRADEPSDALIRVLGVPSSRLSRVRQSVPGFTGAVIHFGEGPMSHVAALEPWGKDTPIGQFFFRHGPGIYLASAMSEQLAAIRDRLGSLGHAAPVRAGDGLLLIPSQLLGGARLAVFGQAAGCSSWDVTSPVFDAQAAWA